MTTAHVLTRYDGSLDVCGIFCDTCPREPLLVYGTQADVGGPKVWRIAREVVDPAVREHFGRMSSIYLEQASLALHLQYEKSAPLTLGAVLRVLIAHCYPVHTLDPTAYATATTLLGLGVHPVEAFALYEDTLAAV